MTAINIMSNNITYTLRVMNLADGTTEDIPCSTFKALQYAYEKYQNDCNYHVMQAYMSSHKTIGLDCIGNDMPNKWIPCYQKLPEKQDMYIVTLADGSVTTGFFSTTKAKNYFEEIRSNNPVVAWMPRPKAWQAADYWQAAHPQSASSANMPAGIYADPMMTISYYDRLSTHGIQDAYRLFKKDYDKLPSEIKTDELESYAAKADELFKKILGINRKELTWLMI